ncbi:MAG: hypothetical protein RI937_1788, partial [Pseudomonadota bacterium]
LKNDLKRIRWDVQILWDFGERLTVKPRKGLLQCRRRSRLGGLGPLVDGVSHRIHGREG